MVTQSEYINNDVYKGCVTLFGLSTDDKPTNVGNGSFFIEIDNFGAKDENGDAVNFMYCFDAENNEWYPATESADENNESVENTRDEISIIDNIPKIEKEIPNTDEINERESDVIDDDV